MGSSIGKPNSPKACSSALCKSASSIASINVSPTTMKMSEGDASCEAGSETCDIECPSARNRANICRYVLDRMCMFVALDRHQERYAPLHVCSSGAIAIRRTALATQHGTREIAVVELHQSACAAIRICREHQRLDRTARSSSFRASID